MLALGALVGLFNGVLVEIAQIDAFIATLGTGTILYAIAMWHSQGQQIVGVAPDGFYALAGAICSGCRSPAIMCSRCRSCCGSSLEYLPIGRYFYAIGANPKAAALNGVPVRRYTIYAFVASGLLDRFAGVCSPPSCASDRRASASNICCRRWSAPSSARRRSSPAASMSGARWSASAILAIGISGIQQFGAAFFVEPLFNGSTLLVAIGIAGYAQRARRRRRAGDPGANQRSAATTSE